MSLPEYDTVGWGIITGSPWWPMYVCDPNKLRPKLHRMGGEHATVLKKAKNFPNDYRVVYWFGEPSFSLMRKGTMKAWNGEEHASLVEGHPKGPFTGSKKQAPSTTIERLQIAIQEAEDFLSQDENMRLLPNMVPSDMNPSMPTPPPDDDSEDEAADDDDDDDGDVEKDDVDVAAADGGDDDDDDEKPLKAKKKDSKEAKKSKKKKPSSKRKASKSSDDKAKKRKKKSSKDEKPPKPPKVSEVDTSAPLSDVRGGADDALKVRIEHEIRQILLTGDMELLTTRKIRKHLTETLQMDLKDHKDTIKEVVHRIIAGMEIPAGTAAAAADKKESKEEPGLLPEPSDVLRGIQNASGLDDLHQHVETLVTIASQLNEDQIASISARVIDWTTHKDSRISELAKSLVATWKLQLPSTSSLLGLDEIEALKTTLEIEGTPIDVMLESLAALSKEPIALDLLKKTKIIVTVTQLRHHTNDRVASAAKDLRYQWKKYFTEPMSKVDAIRRELEKHATDHEAHVATLHALDAMQLSTQQLVDSQIGQVVSKLRKSKYTHIY
ncbi:hypothetical protein, variant 1 [Aphanomyces astaci]|uniref:TFIIS N-terminal domain-containing protein n=2 Tax=Aphanomyces astaci TaxID=112090 RepID=W4FGB9_APHAT|nr:hypothetical protein, variant 1 [Aphanomyces astaci]ETV66485.1 hypothetical protein, variant 1 [Aphanomyces astaci]|eukprot:XP_009844014.1 hypothetical protein, variant 1 [Aphanomyces astaci]